MGGILVLAGLSGQGFPPDLDVFPATGLNGVEELFDLQRHLLPGAAADGMNNIPPAAAELADFAGDDLLGRLRREQLSPAAQRGNGRGRPPWRPFSRFERVVGCVASG